jgi:hypothetical protein
VPELAQADDELGEHPLHAADGPNVVGDDGHVARDPPRAISLTP